MKCVFISCFNAYDNRISLIEKILEGNGYQCTFITSDFHHEQKKYYKISRHNVVQIETIPYTKNFSIKRLLSHFLFSYKAINYIEKIKPDVLYVMLPPNSLAYFAARYKKKHSAKLVFDIYDLWPETFPSKTHSALLFAPFEIWRKLRNSNLSYADVIVTECDLFADRIKSFISNVKTVTLYPVKKVEFNRDSTLLNQKSIDVCYLGSINNIIDIDNICKLLDKVNRLKPVIVHIIGDGEKRDRFIKLLEEKNIDVVFYGRIYDDGEKQDIFNKCALGINMMKDSVCVGLTLKSIDYLHAGLPLLNNIKGDTYEIVKNHEIGINVDDDLNKVAQRIANLDEEKIDQLKKRTLEIYKRYFSIETFNSKVYDIFNLINQDNYKE